ncbi:MAG: hypothetical protein JRN21_10150 [Nitrososphaerota archaeon]|nr:hypothetical protein [Nitrososphaerota archaeon]
MPARDKTKGVSIYLTPDTGFYAVLQLRYVKGKTIVVSDFDDTLMFSARAVAEAAENITGIRMTRKEVRALTQPLKGSIYQVAKIDYNHLFSPNRDAIEYVKECKRNGCDIVVLSAGLVDFSDQVRDLLGEYGVPYDRLVLRESPQSSDEAWKKMMVASLADGYSKVILLEDKAENIDIMVEALAGKVVESYLIDENGMEQYIPTARS